MLVAHPHDTLQGAGYFGGNSEIAKIVWFLSALLVVVFMIFLFVEAHMHSVDHAIIFRMTGFMMTSSVLCFARWRALWNGWPILVCRLANSACTWRTRLTCTNIAQANVSLSLLCLICSGGLVMIYFEGTDFVIHTVYGIEDSLDDTSNLTLFDFDFTWIDHIGDDGRSSRMKFYIILTSVLCFVRQKELWDDTSYERYVCRQLLTVCFPNSPVLGRRWFPEDLYPYVNWFTLVCWSHLPLSLLFDMEITHCICPLYIPLEKCIVGALLLHLLWRIAQD